MTEMERKSEKSSHKFCGNCGSSEFKDWNDLSSDEKFIAERTSAGKFSGDEIKRRSYCARCFYAAENAGENRA